MRLGDIFKGAEAEWQRYVPVDEWMVVRIDGRAFHTYCRGLARPYDTDLMWAMDQTAQAVADELGQKTFAYTQSDEISLLSPPLSPPSERLFGGRTDKILSVLASLATVAFNDAFDHPRDSRATFDARVFALQGRDIVDEYLRWRMADARRNAVSMVAEHYLPRRQLHGCPTPRRIELLAEKGVRMEDTDAGFRHGRRLVRTPVVMDVPYTRDGVLCVAENVVRHTWDIDPATADPSEWDVDPALDPAR